MIKYKIKKLLIPTLPFLQHNHGWIKIQTEINFINKNKSNKNVSFIP